MSEPGLKRRAVLTGVGSYLPETIVTNAEMAARVDTSDEWIVARTGIRQRHFAASYESAAFMGAAAAKGALAMAGLSAEQVGGIIVATSTPDQAFPATALRIQAELGCKNAFGFDVAAACAGFIYALSAANAMILTGQVDNVLIIGTEVYSRIIDFEDRTTCVLFGDGAGTVLLQAQNVAAGGSQLFSTHLHADGGLGDILYVDGAVGHRDKSGYLKMNGREVFRHAVTLLSSSVTEALAANGFAIEDLDWLVPHQANVRIIDGVGRRLGLAPERVIVTLDRHANTSAASVPLALAAGVHDGRIKKNQLVMLEALGGGLAWGSALLRM